MLPSTVTLNEVTNAKQLILTVNLWPVIIAIYAYAWDFINFYLCLTLYLFKDICASILNFVENTRVVLLRFVKLSY